MKWTAGAFGSVKIFSCATIVNAIDFLEFLDQTCSTNLDSLYLES